MFQQRGKSKFLDFLQKKFYNIDYWKNVFTYWAATDVRVPTAIFTKRFYNIDQRDDLIISPLL